MFDILMETSRFALHKHVSAFGRTIRAYDRALKGVRYVTQVDKRRVFVCKRYNGRLIDLPSMFERVPTKHAQKRRVRFEHTRFEAT
jgi:hypothetical protein